jgi:Apea-like HEPN
MKKQPKKKVTANPKTPVLAKPSPNALTEEGQTEVIGEVTTAVQQSLNFLKSRHATVAAFGDFDTFVAREDEADPKNGTAIEYHLLQLRAAIARSLWRRKVFLGIEIIDRLLFDVIVYNAGQILRDFFDTLFAHGVPSVGVIVYPLHSFGVLGLGFFSFFEKSQPDIIIKDANLAISAQTNGEEASIGFLERTVTDLGLDRKIERSEIEHYVRSRSLKWFTANPLLVVSMATLTGSYYENQFIYVIKLKLSTALIMMLSTVGDPQEPDERLLQGSSARVNNWQTLDIHHYLVLEPSIRDQKLFEVRCVPMNVARLELAELSDLNTDIDPRVWSSKRAGRRLARIRLAIAILENGYFEHHVLGENKKLRARVYRKVMTSLDYFRRSFRVNAHREDAIVSLAIAFEALMIDAYASGVTARLHRRVQLALRGVKGIKKYRKIVVDLFKARGAIVHSGSTDVKLDIVLARRAYIECFVVIANKLKNLPSKGDHPIGRLLGDTL